MEPQQKPPRHPLYNVVAMLAFIIVLGLIGWLAVRFVNGAPGVFSSLASIYDSMAPVESNEPMDFATSVTGESEVVTPGDTITIDWEAANQTGDYTFTYTCQDDVTLSLVGFSGLRGLICDTPYNLGDVTSIEAIVDGSALAGSTTIAYEVRFTRPQSATVLASAQGEIAISAPKPEPEPAPEPEPTPEPEPEPAPVPEPEPEPAPEPEPEPVPEPTPAPVTPTVRYETFTYTPVSTPNGTPDLTVTFEGVGTISNDRFISGRLDDDRDGAIQFEVRNRGTRTSEEWYYQIALPNGPYRSPLQDPLRPNEYALITLGFPIADAGTHTFAATIVSSDDQTTINNRFAETVRISE